MDEPQCRIELLCGLLSDHHDDVEQERWDETIAMQRKAEKLCGEKEVHVGIQEHHDSGNEETYSDAYVYPPLSKAEEILTLLDKHEITYDNIDLPEQADAELVARLKARYPKGSGVMVNEDNY